MNIGRKIYYEKATGNVLVDTGERCGDVIETTIEQDFATYHALKQRVPETVGYISLEYGQLSQDFMGCNGYRINLETLEIEFIYPDTNEPEPIEPVYKPPLSQEIEALKARQEATESAILALMDISL